MNHNRLNVLAVLVYAAIKSPLAQPRNLIGGHMISGLIGVACFKLFGDTLWIAAFLSVSFAIAAMLVTKTLHLPGGATALIAVIGGEKIHNLGFLYAVVPAGAGALILLIVALIVNNLSRDRSYPEFWL
ncbi:MAG: HPP family protein [Nitrospirae bacterium]|nr:HPP family protein [Nitrospirota bacterium]